MLLRCYSLCFLFVICATDHSGKRNGAIDLDSNEEYIITQEKEKTSKKKHAPNNELIKTKGEDDTDIEVSDYNELIIEEETDESAHSTRKETTSDAGDMLKKEFEMLDHSKSSADKFVHFTNMTELSGFNYSPTEMEKFKIWVNGIVPFFIDEYSFDKILCNKIREYLEATNVLSGLQFLEIPKPPDDDQTRWVLFLNRRGQLHCTDYNHNSFTEVGVQKVILGYDCLVGRKEMAAVVLAIAGVPPQHNSPDRDNYIEISMKSVLPDKTSLFNTVLPHQWIFYDIQYDFLSASHYPYYKYTADGSATITARNKQDVPEGESEDFSLSDIMKIRMLYNYIASVNYNNLKLTDCQTLYHRGPNFQNYKLSKPEKQARKKPQKYVEATKQVGEKILDGKDGKKLEKKHFKPLTAKINKLQSLHKEGDYDAENYFSSNSEKENDIIGAETNYSYFNDVYDNIDSGKNKKRRKPKHKFDLHRPADPLKWDDIRTYESE